MVQYDNYIYIYSDRLREKTGCRGGVYIKGMKLRNNHKEQTCSSNSDKKPNLNITSKRRSEQLSINV